MFRKGQKFLKVIKSLSLESYKIRVCLRIQQSSNDLILPNTECECLDEDYTTQETTTTTTTTTTATTPCFGNCTFGACGWIGDDYCDDGANNVDCNFDGGDCCGPNVNTDYCTGTIQFAP